MTEADVRVQYLAATRGPLGRQELKIAGLTDDQIDYRASVGSLIVLRRGIYLVPSVSDGYGVRLRAALLAAHGGAVVSHTSGMALWGFPGIEPTVPEITVVGRSRPIVSDVVIHRVNRLEAIDRTTRGGLAVTTPARTMLDYAAVAAAEDLERALEYGLYADLLTIRRVRRVLDRLGGKGRRGTAALRALLDARDPLLAPTESELEFVMGRLIDRYNVPQPVRQLWIVTDDGDRFRLDFPYPDIMLALEVDGRFCHSGRRDFLRDRQRTRALVRLGWAPLPFTWTEVKRQPRATAAEIIAEVSRRRSLAS
jgi:hypothetical protein